MVPRGKQNAAPSTDPSATFLARQTSDPGTKIGRENDILSTRLTIVIYLTILTF